MLYCEVKLVSEVAVNCGCKFNFVAQWSTIVLISSHQRAVPVCFVKIIEHVLGMCSCCITVRQKRGGGGALFSGKKSLIAWLI